MTQEDREWLGERFAAIDARFDAVETRFKEDPRFEELGARIERMETTLLTEFHKWASPMEARIRSHTAVLRALDLQTEALADRVTKLEPKQ